MAYRMPSERREPPPQLAHQTSYLDDFLDQIESLPSRTRAVFHEMHVLEERVATAQADASAAGAEAVARATTKGVPTENVKRAYQEFIHLQNNAAEFAAKKVSLAKDARERIVAALADLDSRLVEFEAQLRKEGRWPAPDAPPGLTAKVPRGKPPVSPKNAKAPVRVPPPEQPSGRATQKARRREGTGVGIANPTTPRAAALAAARAKEAAAKADAAAAEEAAKAAEDASGDVVMDTADSAGADSKQYCICRGVSSGEMVGCEGKHCSIEWFHFACVGLTKAPEGSWFCNDCLGSSRRKNTGGRRKQTA